MLSGCASNRLQPPHLSDHEDDRAGGHQSNRGEHHHRQYSAVEHGVVCAALRGVTGRIVRRLRLAHTDHNQVEASLI